jgi:hypothetical protein
MALSRFLLSRLFCLLLAGSLAGCGSEASLAPAPTPTPSRPGPALVQVENSVQARPQSGLQQADLVFEYLAEGGITRMTVIYFHPTGGTRIGPVRSARPVTLRLQKAYQGVVFFSGANQKVLDQIHAGNVPALSEGSDGGQYFFRDPGRQPPHNLYTTGDRLAAGLRRHAPSVSYRLPAPGQPSTTPAPAAANRVQFDQTSFHRVIYTYSTADGAYAYNTVDGPLVDQSTGQAIKVVNVILLQVSHHDAGFTDVLGAPAQDFDLQGSGPADLFSGGHRYGITWDLSDPQSPVRFLDAAGKPVHLAKGLTWVHLVDPGTAIAVS